MKCRMLLLEKTKEYDKYFFINKKYLIKEYEFNDYLSFTMFDLYSNKIVHNYNSNIDRFFDEKATGSYGVVLRELRSDEEEFYLEFDYKKQEVISEFKKLNHFSLPQPCGIRPYHQFGDEKVVIDGHHVGYKFIVKDMRTGELVKDSISDTSELMTAVSFVQHSYVFRELGKSRSNSWEVWLLLL